MSYKAPRIRDGVEFRIYSTEKLKAAKSDDGKMRIKGIASSTVRDHHGDIMERSALQDMILAASDNMTIFLNHQYRVPEDIFGSVEKAALRRVNEATEDSDFYHTLLMDIVVDEANPRAVKTWEHIENGTKLGLSIGAMIPTDGWSYDDEKELYVIHHVVLLETSVVSIPANPKSWVTNAIKAIKSFEGVEGDDDEEDVVLRLSGEDLINVVDSVKVEGVLVDGPVEGEVATEVVTEAADSEELVDEDDPTVDHQVDDSDAEVTELTSDVEPDTITDPVEEVTETESTEPTSQEAPEATPETEDGAADPAEVVIAGLEDEGPDLSSLSGIVENLKALTAQASDAATMEETVKALEEEKRKRLEQDKLIEDLMKVSGQMLAGLTQAVELLGKVPAGRKTHFVTEAKDVTEGLQGIYNSEFLNLYQAFAKKE